MDLNYTVCEYIKNNHYLNSFNDIKGSVDIIYSLLIFFGIYITYWGNKYMKINILLVGFFPGFYIIYYLTSIILNHLEIHCSTIFYFSLLGGLISSSICYSSLKISYGILGIMTGLSFGYILNIIIFQFIHIGTLSIYNNSFLISESIMGVLGFCLFYKKRDIFIVTLTSLIGPIFIIKYFDKLVVGNISTPKFIIDINTKQDSIALMLYVISYILLSLTGIIVQYRRYRKTIFNESSYSITVS